MADISSITLPNGDSYNFKDSEARSSIPDISGKADKSSTVSDVAYDSTNKKITKTINGTTSDVVTAATLKTAMSLAKGDVGLGNVDNVKQYSASNPPPYPVTSVNGNTGAVTISIPESYWQYNSTNDSIDLVFPS